MASSMVTRSLAVCSTAESRSRAREEKRSVFRVIGASSLINVSCTENSGMRSVPRISSDWGILSVCFVAFLGNLQTQTVPCGAME